MLKGQKKVQAEEAKRFRELIKKGFVKSDGRLAIDGGAHVGSWSVEMARYFDLVMAFEPCKESYDMLCQNVPENVTCLDVALMDKECGVKVVLPKGGRKTLTARQVNYGGDMGAVSIDSLNLEDCDLIKLDLEGCERLALDGARETIKKFRPFLLVEMNNLGMRFGYSDESIKACLEGMGYKVVWRDDVDWGFMHTQEIKKNAKAK